MKKLLLCLSIALLAMCLFTVAVSASTIYRDESGTALLSCEMANDWEIDSYEILNGGFAKVDGEGNALTWYLISTATEGENTIKIVKPAKTSEVYANGNFTNGVAKDSVVSVNFEEGMTSICGFGGFPNGSHEILFVYIPASVTTLPERFMQNGSALVCEIPENSQLKSTGVVPFYQAKNLRSLYIPASLETIGYSTGHEFAVGASRLESVEFADDSKLQVIPHGTFSGCSSLKRITLPNSVTTIGSRVFQDCRSLEYINFGANLRYMEKTSNNHSLAFCAAALKTVVIPCTFVAENIEATLDYCFQPSWANTSQITFYYTGTEAQFKALQEKFAAAGNNGEIVGASLENGRLVLVDHCETFYGGHEWTGEENVLLDSYFTSIGIGDSCVNCSKYEVAFEIPALFESKGYSTKTFGDDIGIIQGYAVNRAAIVEYKKYVPDFDFGILAAANIDNAADFAPKPGDDKVVDIVFDNMANDYVEVKLTGIPEEQYETLIVFCVYATEGEDFYYLDDGVMSKTVLGKKYSEFVEKEENQ